jgi:hypothetical protein
MKLRVLPPKELNYPDPLIDGLRFYNLIGCPSLKLKYMLQEDLNSEDVSDEEFNVNDVKMMVY